MSLYDDLGVDKAADKATIKRAYRKRAQKDHPDKGGDKEKFYAIQRAYDILYDDTRRAHYDAYGTDGVQDKQNALMQRLAALLMALIEAGDVDHTDLIGQMREKLQQGKQTTVQAIRQQEQKIAKYERAVKRMQKSGAGENVFAQMIAEQVSIFKRGVELGKAELVTIDEMIALLKDYKYKVDPGGARNVQWSSLAAMMQGNGL